MKLFTKRVTDWQQYINESDETDITNINKRAKRNLTFLGVDQNTLVYREQAANVILNYKNEIIEKLIERYQTIDRFQHVIQKYTRIESLHEYLDDYLTSFLSDNLDQHYIEKRLQIGKKQSEVHLTPEFFIPAYKLLIQYVQAVLIANIKSSQQLANALLAIEKLSTFDLQLIEQAYFENTNKYFFFHISEMLNQITKLDTTENLINGVDNQMEETHNVSAATEEMGASIQEVASSAVNVAENTDAAVTSAKESQTTISRSLDDIKQIGKVYNDVVERVGQLEKEIQHTKDVIEIIKGVASQTNLLALNASIEAARAGEQGKGFSVVASEVRKLSEHTNEQIIKIESNMESLREVSIQVTNEITQTAGLVEKTVDGSELAEKELEKIVITMQDILNSTSQIAAMSEEQTSAVQDIAERSHVIYNLSQDTQQIATDTGTLIFNLSKEMEEYRNQFLGIRMHMEYEDIIKIAMTDHLMLKWKIYNGLLGVTNLSIGDLPTHTTCHLGDWYYGNQPEHIRNMPTFQALEEPHRMLHEFSHEAVRNLENGDIDGAREALHNLDMTHERLIELLNAMK